MLGSGLNLVTTVIGFGMSATFIIFVCARLICGRARSVDSPLDPESDLELQSDLDQPERAIGGVEPPVVAAMPTVKYSLSSFTSGDDAQCSICLGDYEEKEILRILPTCCHNFHRACIDIWLQKQSTCPICRLPLNDSFGAKSSSQSFSVLQLADDPVISSDISNRWVLPSNHRSELSENIQEIHESASGRN